MLTKQRAWVVVGVLTLCVMIQASPRSQAPSEQELLRRVTAQPNDIANYLDLAKLYARTRRFDDAEQMLVRSLALVRQARTAPFPPPGAAPVGTGITGGVIGGVTAGAESAKPALSAPAPPPPRNAPVRVGRDIKEPTKIKDVSPVYPKIAQSARVQGVVTLEVIIDRGGNVRNAKIIRSVPLLDQAAIDAVRQWQYTPTLINDAPVEVIMTVMVTFKLS